MSAIKLIIGLVLIGYVLSLNTKPRVPIINSESYEGPVIPIQSPSGLIAGGEEAIPHEFPWQTYVTGRVANWIFYCGGVIIDKEYVLTAARCTHAADEVTLVMGAHNVTANELTQDRRVITDSANWKSHETYRSNRLDYNIALIKLDPPITLNKYINTITLNAVEPEVNTMVTLSGWGKTGDGDTDGKSSVLKKTNMMTAWDRVCRNHYAVLKNLNYDSLGCLETINSFSSLCEADTGGPMIHEGPDGMVLDGLIGFSSAKGCAKGHPAMYTSIQYFYDWISENMG